MINGTTGRSNSIVLIFDFFFFLKKNKGLEEQLSTQLQKGIPIKLFYVFVRSPDHPLGVQEERSHFVPDFPRLRLGLVVLFG